MRKSNGNVQRDMSVSYVQNIGAKWCIFEKKKKRSCIEISP